jgi:Flp pilus assembly protein TadD
VTTRTFLSALLFLSAACAGGSAGSPRAAAPSPAAAAAPAAPPSARAERLFADALRAQEDQRKLAVPTDWPLLERKWRAVVDAADVPEARFNLGVTLAEQGRLDEARAEYERALAGKPTLRQAAVNLALLVEQQGDPRAAAAAYARVLRDFPEDAVARARLATLYEAAGQLDESWRLAREALQRDPRSVAAHVVMIRVALARKDLDLAKLVAMRAQKLDPKNAEIVFLEGEVLAREGEEGAAGEHFRRALALDPGFRSARSALFEAAVRGEMWGAVVEHGQALLRTEPNDARVHLAVGIAQRHLGRPDEALASYAQAEKLSGGALPEVFLARGVLQMRVKNACEPALASLQAYARAAGPSMPPDGQVTKLQRECEQILEQNRLAAEAAKQMQAEAARKAAAEAAKKAPPAAAGPAAGEKRPAPETKAPDGRARPTSPSPAR